MIVKQDKLKQASPELNKAVELFAWGLGKYDVLILKAEKNSVEFNIQKFSFRFKTNNEIAGAIEWIKQQVPGVNIVTSEVKKHELFTMSMKLTKEKKEKIEIKSNEENESFENLIVDEKDS